MAGSATASNPMAVALACGGYRDNLCLLAALAQAYDLSFVEISGGAYTLEANQVACVTDGSALTLPASPSTGTALIVLSSNGQGTVSPNSSQTINGASGAISIGGNAVPFVYNGTTWVT